MDFNLNEDEPRLFPTLSIHSIQGNRSISIQRVPTQYIAFDSENTFQLSSIASNPILSPSSSFHSHSLERTASPLTQTSQDASLVRHFSELPPGHGQCRVCLCEDELANLIQPCLCAGSSRWVHRSCLDQWRNQSTTSFFNCSVCKYKFKFMAVNTSWWSDCRLRSSFDQSVCVVLFSLVLYYVLSSFLNNPVNIQYIPFKDSLYNGASMRFVIIQLIAMILGCLNLGLFIVSRLTSSKTPHSIGITAVVPNALPTMVISFFVASGLGLLLTSVYKCMYCLLAKKSVAYIEDTELFKIVDLRNHSSNEL